MVGVSWQLSSHVASSRRSHLTRQVFASLYGRCKNPGASGFSPFGQGMTELAMSPLTPPPRQRFRTKMLAHLLMVFAGTSFGGYNVLLAGVTSFPENMPPKSKYCRQSAFMTYRIGGATVLFLIGAAVSGQRIEVPRTGRLVGHLLLQGITGIWIVQYLFLLGVGRTSDNVGAVMAALTPAAVALTAIVLRMERMTWRKCLGVLLGVAGAFVTLGFGVISGGYRADIVGVIVLGVCLCASAVYCLELRSFGNDPQYTHFSSFQQTMWQYIVGGIFMGLTSTFCWDELDAFKSPGPPIELTWIAVGYAVVVASGMNYWIMTWCGRHLEASTLGVYGLIQPFSTALISYVAFGTPVTLSVVLGTAMVAGSILLIAWQQALDEASSAATKGRSQVEETDPLIASVNRD